MKLCLPELHYHSITAHVSVITVPLTALAYALFLYTGNLLFNVAHACLAAMTFFSFFAVFPTGYLEREHKYINWTPLFVWKMILSGLHITALLYQFVVIVLHGGVNAIPFGLPYAIVVIGFQTLVMGGLTYLGLITAQGRFGGRVVYRKDPEYARSYDLMKIVQDTQPDPLKEEPYDRF